MALKFIIQSDTSYMQPVQSIVYLYLTHADFFNMYKDRGAEARGGGQAYIDFPRRGVSLVQWRRFLGGVNGLVEGRLTNGPSWKLPIKSVGVPDSGGTQEILIYQRRANVCITNQTLGRRGSNRVKAWHPDYGFPRPLDRRQRQQRPTGLAVFLARSGDQVWAGWFLNDGHTQLPASHHVRAALQSLLTRPTSDRDRAGVIEFTAPTVWLDENNRAEPFQSSLGAGSPVSPGPTAEARKKQKQRIRATDSQGYELSPKRRKAVESHAMKRAAKAYPGAEDTSKTKSFDLRAHDGTTEVRIEVKGTLGTGEQVILTTNEIQNARGDGWRTDLFIVSGIKLEERDGQFIASGGRTRVIRGWRPLDEDLTPTQYRYKVPR